MILHIKIQWGANKPTIIIIIIIGFNLGNSMSYVYQTNEINSGGTAQNS